MFLNPQELLEGKTALVTGGGIASGLASAVGLAAAGAHVFITGRRETAVDRAVEVIGSAAPAATGDISNLAHLDRLYETIRSRGRGLGVLLANASVAASVAAFATLERVTEERFDSVLGVFFRENSGPRRRSARTGLAPPHVVGAAGPGGGGSGVSWAGS